MKRYQNGAILPLTLMIIAILMMIGSILVIKSNSSISDAQIAKDRFEARLKIHSAEQRLFFGIYAGERLPVGYQIGNLFLRSDGEPVLLSNGVSLSIQDIMGLVSLRFIKRNELRTLLSIYVDSETAKDITEKIISWQRRNPENYGRQDLFRSMDELLLIDGITPDIYNGTENKPGLKNLFALNNAIENNFSVVPNFLLKNMYSLTNEQIDRIEKLKIKKRWNHLSRYLSELGLGSELVPSSRMRVYYEYNGFRAVAEYQIHSATSLPPPIRLWRFPDNKRHFMMVPASGDM